MESLLGLHSAFEPVTPSAQTIFWASSLVYAEPRIQAMYLMPLRAAKRAPSFTAAGLSPPWRGMKRLKPALAISRT